MLDHITLIVSDYARAKTFYENARAPLGYKTIMEFGPSAGLGDGRPDLWIAQGKPGSITHVAITATDRKTVDAFYKAAMAAGGKDNGKPCVPANYHPNYYGAFVLDPDGHNIAAVCHTTAYLHTILNTVMARLDRAIQPTRVRAAKRFLEVPNWMARFRGP